MKVPFKKIKHNDSETDRMQGHVEDALNRLGSQTQDDWADGTLFKRVLGVNHDNLLTNSGIASATITGSKIAAATVAGSNLVAATVTVDKLAACNQVNVYRTTAFSCGPNARSALIANNVLKDVGAGYNTANGIYTLPASGDWTFSWSVGLNTMTNDGKEMFTALVINSGEVLGNVQWTSGANQYQASQGSYLYCNGRTGDTVAVRVFNGDTVPASMAVASGSNYFVGYQVR